MNSSDVARKPLIFGVVDQKAFNVVAVYLIIELSIKYRPYAAQKRRASSAPKPPKPLKAPQAWESYSQSFQATQYIHGSLSAVATQQGVEA